MSMSIRTTVCKEINNTAQSAFVTIQTYKCEIPSQNRWRASINHPIKSTIY